MLDNSIRTSANMNESATTILFNTITGTAQTELFLDGASARLSLGYNRANTFMVLLTSICKTVGTSGTLALGNAASYGYTCAASNINGTSQLLGGTAKAALFTATGDTTGASMLTGASVAITVDDTTDTLQIKYTPPTAAVSTSVFVVTAMVISCGAGWAN